VLHAYLRIKEGKGNDVAQNAHFVRWVLMKKGALKVAC
jgi:hypothetical protein